MSKVRRRNFLSIFEWWKLEPSRERLQVAGAANPLPTAKDLTPPHLALLDLAQ